MAISTFTNPSLNGSVQWNVHTRAALLSYLCKLCCGNLPTESAYERKQGPTNSFRKVGTVQLFYRTETDELLNVAALLIVIPCYSRRLPYIGFCKISFAVSTEYYEQLLTVVTM